MGGSAKEAASLSTATTALPNPTRLRLRVHVQPRASRSRLVGLHGDAIKLQLAAPPVDGAANAALIDLLAAALKVRRGDVRLVAGERSRNKTVDILCHDPEVLRSELERLIRGNS